MLRPQGYGVVTDPDAPLIEHDTFTCSHCNRVVMVQPGWSVDKLPSQCKGCMGYLCLNCWGKRTLGAACNTWMQQLDQIEARENALRSYGL